MPPSRLRISSVWRGMLGSVDSSALSACPPNASSICCDTARAA